MFLKQINKTYSIAFCLLTIISLTFSQEKTAVQIKNEYGKAVVMIATYKEQKNAVGLGSGFIVSENGVIITNYHVIDGAFPAMIKLLNGDVYEDISVIDYDAKKDIAVIKIKGWNLPTVTLGNSDNVEIGEKVYVIGNPEGLENTVSDGLLSGLRDTGKGYKLHQISAPISHGSSGSPVFNSRGDVIGVASLSIIEGQNLNFSIPINYVRGMVSDKPKMSLEDFAKIANQKEETFGEFVSKMPVKNCLSNLVDITNNFWSAIEIYNESYAKTTEPHTKEFQRNKWKIDPDIYTASEIFKYIDEKLNTFSSTDEDIEEIRVNYLAVMNKVVEGIDSIMQGFEGKNGFPNFGKSNKGFAKIELATGDFYRQKDKLVNLVQKNYPELRDSLLPFYLETKEIDPHGAYIGFGYYVGNRRIVIKNVVPNSPAEKVGLAKGDIILGIKNGPEFPTIIEYSDFMEQQKVGSNIELLILRNGEKIVKKVKLVARP